MHWCSKEKINRISFHSIDNMNKFMFKAVLPCSVACAILMLMHSRVEGERSPAGVKHTAGAGVQHIYVQHTAGVKLPGFAALRTHFARDQFNLCSLALVGESLISFCQASLAIRSRFSEEQIENWFEFI